MKNTRLVLVVALSCVVCSYGNSRKTSLPPPPSGRYDGTQCSIDEYFYRATHHLSAFLSENMDGVVEDDSNILSDANFKYVIGGKDKRRVVRINRQATLYDLCNFADAVCWNAYLKPRISSATKISAEDAEMFQFCIAANLDMMGTVACAVLTDMLGSPFARNHIYPDVKDLCVEMGNLFVDGKDGVRKVIRDWAGIYNAAAPFTIYLLFGEVNAAIGNVNLSGSSRTPNPTMEESMKIMEPGTIIRERWLAVRELIKLYPARLGEIRRTIKAMRDRGISDSFTLQRLDYLENMTRNRCKYFDYVLYDLPFCILTYRALGQLRNCKGGHLASDDEDRMRVVASDYTYAICGTEMLKRIRTRYAASCYTAVIEFLKDELGWWVLGNTFKDFANETKLYKITMEEDESGEQDNKLNAL